ncbi:tail fiber domain-containing protein [Bacillus safensis]|uniref:tail fiber domain-containing protein n=1 Tax=Bacillus safensis TaxID=561879 RepID=UPI0020CDE596|nr:tail fiber domain-containing protein [Bacillus safensis]MCP9283672.1 tail fiber domain-containing protein [Bacillus safensis]
MALEKDLIPVNTMGIKDEDTGEWIPLDAVALRSHTDRITIDDIRKIFEEIYKDITKVDNTAISKFKEIMDAIGDISSFSTGDNLIDKIKNTLTQFIVNIIDYGGIGDGKFDNKPIFENLSNGKMPVFLPHGTFFTTALPEASVFGFGELIVNNERIPIDSNIPQKVYNNIVSSSELDGFDFEGQRYLNFIIGQNAGKKLGKSSRGNVAVGHNSMSKGATNARSTAVGKMTLQNVSDSYASDAFGSDALGQGSFSNRNTGLGSNSLKWAGITDAIETKHDYWLEKGAENFINRYFLSKWPTVWADLLGSENVPSPYLYPRTSDEIKENVGVGRNSLVHLIKGLDNTAVGYNSQAHNTIGNENTSLGARSLRDNLKGEHNTAIGNLSMANNLSGSDNVALGANTLQQSVHASNNTVVGFGAMHFFKDNNTSPNGEKGKRNTAIGTQAMQDSEDTSFSTFVGSYAGQNVKGDANTGVGSATMQNLTTGERNTSIGQNTGLSIIKGSNNTNIGYTAGPDGDFSNTTSIGTNAHAQGNNQIQIGTSDETVYTFKPVQQRSDMRDKTSIRSTQLGLDFVNKLKPVDYKYISGQSDRYHHGVIAQDIEKLKGYEFGGLDNSAINGGNDVYTVAYTEFIAPLIKAVQELSKKVEELEAKQK